MLVLKNIFFVATHVSILVTWTGVIIITTGTSLCQTAVVRTVTDLFTRRTLSLTQPILRTSVRLLSQEFAGYCQVLILILINEK